MIGVVGSCKTGIVLSFITNTDKGVGTALPIKTNLDSTLLGYWTNFKTNEDKLDITYTDTINRCFVTVHRDNSCPKIKIYAKLPNSDGFAVPEFYLQGHLRIETIKIISANKFISGDKINPDLKAGKKVDLWSKLFFLPVGEPLVIKQVKASSIGDIEVVRKKVTGVEI